jgi:ABC-2 type transport system permease protein
MTRAVVLKELWEGIYGYKFLLSFLLALLVIPSSIYVGMERFKQERAEYNTATQEAREAVLRQSPKGPHAAAHFGVAISKPPTPMLALSSGIHEILGVRAQIDPHTTPQLGGSQYNRTPVLLLFGKLDYVIVIQVIFGLFALILAADIISGEKEDGTLKLMLSNPVSRIQLMLGKLLGGVLVLLIPVLSATTLGLLLFATFGVSLTAQQWWGVILIVALSILYLLMMFMLGACVSALTTRRVTSLVTLLMVWVVMIFVLPRVGTSVAQRVHPIPSPQDVDKQIRAIRETGGTKAQEYVKAFLAASPQQEASKLPENVSIESRRLMDEYVEKEEAKVRETVKFAQDRQVRLASGLARLSPSTAYLLAATEIAGTGINRHNRFLRHLDEYRRVFRGHFDALEDKGISKVSRFDDVPQFSYQEEAMTETLGRTLLDTATMVLLGLLLLGTTHGAFVRYDVR